MKTHPKFLPRLAAGMFTLTAGTLPVLTTLTLAPAAARAQPGQPAAQEVSFDFFYNNLADNGDWYNTPDFGYVFQPYIAYKNENWRPYTDGYWAQTDQGWTWVSYEDFGWATYHYGRWSQLENVGWVWVPGYEWGPGWVSWRTSDEYVGWAPLPPKSTRQVASTTLERAGGSNLNAEVRPEDVEEDYDTGYNGGVDVQYDIGPSQYSFVPVQSFGAPYLAEAVVPQAQNIIIIEGTTNVTNIVYRGDRDRRVIYCGGPDYAFLSRRVERPIPRLLLERRTDIGNRDNFRADRFNAVRDNRLEFFAPLVARRPVNSSQLRPLRVKETIEHPQIVHGWRSTQQQDPRLVERLRQQFQQQARQAPPARQAVENFVTPAAFRAQPPPNIQEQQRLHQPPPPRTAEGNRFGERPPGAEGNRPPAGFVPPQPNAVNRPPPGAPAVNPNPAIQPVPGPGGRNLSNAEREARRDARQQELQQRQGGRPATAQPANPPAPPNVVNRDTPPATVAPGQPPRPNRSEQERDAYRASKQAEKAREQAAHPSVQPPREPGNQAQPFQTPPANAERRNEESRGARTREQEVQPKPDAAREQRRAARAAQEEQGGQRAAQQQQQQQAAERARAAQEQQREQRRPERSAQAEQAQQAQAEAAARAREARQQQNQERREAAPQPRQQPPQAPEGRRVPEARPQAERPPQPPAQPAQPGKPPEDERKKKHGDNPSQ